MTRRDWIALALVTCSVALYVGVVGADERPARATVQTLSVPGTNDEWTVSQTVVSRGDFVILSAEGRVKIGNWIGMRDADGVTGSQGECGTKRLSEGTLTAKIGAGAPFAVGKAHMFQATSDGPLKLRVHDTDYSDNEGSLTVTIRHVPGALFTPM